MRVFYSAFLGMTIASFVGTLTFADRLGFMTAFANRPDLANDLLFTGRLGLASDPALTYAVSFFNILAIVYMAGLADMLTFADNPGFIVITIAIIV